MLNAAARVITGTRKFDRGLGQILHDQLHWIDVPDRVLFKLAVTVHQCLNGRTPPYLSVSSADTRRHLRSANRHLLAVPRFRLNTYGRRAFSVAGPMAWNTLRDFIRDPTSSTDCFRRLLKKYLFARYLCIQRISGSRRQCAIRIHSLTHSITLSDKSAHFKGLSRAVEAGLSEHVYLRCPRSCVTCRPTCRSFGSSRRPEPPRFASERSSSSTQPPVRPIATEVAWSVCMCV